MLLYLVPRFVDIVDFLLKPSDSVASAAVICHITRRIQLPDIQQTETEPVSMLKNAQVFLCMLPGI